MGNRFRTSALAETILHPRSGNEGLRRKLGRAFDSLPFCIILFLFTLLATLIVGVHMADNYAAHLPVFDLNITWEFFKEIGRHPARLLAGAPYAATVLGILLAHELGHYFTCRYYHIDSTYPFFIPAPTLIGTLGAFIKIKSPLVTRRELFDVGISGPIAGFVVAIPALIVAAARAGVRLGPVPGGSILMGHPLAISLLSKAFHPGIQHSWFSSPQLALTPVGCGAWVGLFATALNLLPMGQLDGGHILYAVLGPVHRYVSVGFFLLLFPLGYFCWSGWFLWAVFMLIIGLRHPPPLIDNEPLDRRRKFVALAALGMFILCFMFSPLIVT
ncbi:MAG: site-2 protease family protein [Acidobacteriota bacterium]|nr:site-2 protease family protein [Acidobacteriota bacterium]